MFSFSSSRLPQLKRQLTENSNLNPMSSQVTYVSEESAWTGLAPERRRARHAVKFLHKYVRNIYKVDYI